MSHFHILQCVSGAFQGMLLPFIEKHTDAVHGCFNSGLTWPQCMIPTLVLMMLGKVQVLDVMKSSQEVLLSCIANRTTIRMYLNGILKFVLGTFPSFTFILSWRLVVVVVVGVGTLLGEGRGWCGVGRCQSISWYVFQFFQICEIMLWSWSCLMAFFGGKTKRNNNKKPCVFYIHYLICVGQQPSYLCWIYFFILCGQPHIYNPRKEHNIRFSRYFRYLFKMFLRDFNNFVI